MKLKPLAEALAARRILLTWLIATPLLAYIVVTVSPWEDSLLGELLLEDVGFVLLVLATLGRVWCLTYIGGYKNDVFLTTGPYSVVRNPLYGFNFLGALGFGLATQHPLVAAVLAAVFVMYYPLVVAREERYLEQRYGEAYLEYKRRTPRWIPDFSLYIEPESCVVRPAFIRKGIFAAAWFLWLFLLWEIVEQLHRLGVLGVSS